MPNFKQITPFTKNDWETPDYFFNLLNEEFCFTVDAAASDANHKCERYWTVETNGLYQAWKNEVVFVNPPFNEKEAWIYKAYKEVNSGNRCTVVMLLPSTTDTKSWHNYVMKADEIRFCEGRVNFISPVDRKKNAATFPLCIVVWQYPSHRKVDLRLDVTTFKHKPE